MKEFGKEFWKAFVHNFAEAQDAFGIAMCILLLYFLVRGRKHLKTGVLPFLLLLGAFFAYHMVISLGAQPIDRYYRPIVPLLCVFAAGGLFCMVKDARKRALGIALVVALGGWYLLVGLRSPIRGHRYEQVVAGRWLADHDPTYSGYVVSSYSQTVLYAGMQFLDAEMGRERLERLAQQQRAPKYCMLEQHEDWKYGPLLRFLSDHHWKLLRTFPQRKIRVWRNSQWITRTLALPQVCAAGPEVGVVAVDHRWHRVRLRGSFEEPVVVAGMITSPRTEPVVLRLRSVGPAEFELRLQEWEHQDGIHRRELVYYLVAERGVTSLPGGGLLEAGRMATSTCYPEWVWQPLAGAFDSAPVVFSQVMTSNDPAPVVTRQQEVGQDGFAVTMQEAEAADGEHGQESVGWIAIEAGTYDFGSWRWEAGVPAQPAVSVPRSVPTGFGAIEVRIQEEWSLDAEMWHVEEQFGYLAFGTNAAYIAQLQTCRGPETAQLVAMSAMDDDTEGAAAKSP